MGLSIVKQIIDYHQGTITVTSKRRRHQRDNYAAVVGGWKMKPHVLIIEDDPSIADLQKDYLEINDMTVTIEHDGKKDWKQL